MSVILVVAAAMVPACKSDNGPVGDSGVDSTATAQSKAMVAKVVFIDKEDACDCTRKRTEAAWAAVQSALGTPPRLSIERLHLDTQAAETAFYTALKPLMVIPGIYFVDANGGVVELLQGEVTTEEVAGVVNGK